jgi:hypothetical protein
LSRNEVLKRGESFPVFHVHLVGNGCGGLDTDGSIVTGFDLIS